MDRRRFLALTSASMAAGAFAQQAPASSSDAPKHLAMPKGAVIVSKDTGLQSSDRAYALLTGGHDTLDAVIETLRTQEDDPNDDSVGYGGLPNEDGEVELDACVMHGPTRRAGAVGGVRNIKNVCKVARLVMERTNHLMLVGEGAQRFAVAHGFPKENLLTEPSRKTWLLWKETNSDKDDWGPGISDPNWQPPADMQPNGVQPGASQPNPKHSAFRGDLRHMQQIAAELGIPPHETMHAIENVLYPPTGTIHCSVVNQKGEMSAGTTTSGLAWKLAGRVGDSPIIGAGCFCDQDIGSAGATGSGEENIKIAGAHTIVENMRRGMSPHDAGMDALKRIARNHNNDMKKLRYLSMVFYVLRRDGAYAGVSMWSHKSSDKRATFHVNDGRKRLEECAYLFEGTPIDWPPDPKAP